MKRIFCSLLALLLATPAPAAMRRNLVASSFFLGIAAALARDSRRAQSVADDAEARAHFYAAEQVNGANRTWQEGYGLAMDASGRYNRKAAAHMQLAVAFGALGIGILAGGLVLEFREDRLGVTARKRF